MARNLLGEAVAAKLNAGRPGVTCFMVPADFVAEVVAAQATGDRGVMEDLKDLLDANSNLVASTPAATRTTRQAWGFEPRRIPIDWTVGG